MQTENQEFGPKISGWLYIKWSAYPDMRII